MTCVHTPAVITICYTSFVFFTFLVSFALCSDGHILTAAVAILFFFSIIMRTHDGVANNDDVRCFGHTFALSRKEGVGCLLHLHSAKLFHIAH